jgi:hypothetical protein
MRCEQARAGNALAQESHKALVTERRGEKVSYQSSGLPFVQPVIVLVAASIVSTYLREQPRWLRTAEQTDAGVHAAACTYSPYLSQLTSMVLPVP